MPGEFWLAVASGFLGTSGIIIAAILSKNRKSGDDSYPRVCGEHSGLITKVEMILKSFDDFQVNIWKKLDDLESFIRMKFPEQRSKER